MSRSSRREVRIRIPDFASSVVYFSRETLPKKKGKRALLGDLDVLCVLWIFFPGGT